ncbi:TetR/AcrR family transcriptional regulator [Isoptericola variabilis]|uniref:TetR/AcrR family transcriptional regulator n=1 Tax=Isoptericola variabilis TaxID=139208 RepID=UPI003D23EDA8
MVPVGRTYAPTHARRRQIISATISVLADEGYAGATFARIREKAGLSSTRLISYHFRSKEALMGAVVEQVVADSAEVIRPALEAATTYPDKLAGYIRSNLEFLARNPASAVAVVQIVRHGARPGVREGADTSVMLLAVLLSQGQHAGELAAFDPEVMARSVRATIDEFASRCTPGRDVDTQEIDQIVALYARATAPERTVS